MKPTPSPLKDPKQLTTELALKLIEYFGLVYESYYNAPEYLLHELVPRGYPPRKTQERP